MSDLISFLDEQNIEYTLSVDLKKKTWIGMGGVADYWVVPSTLGQLAALYRYLIGNLIDYEVVGHTSNLFFRNDYNPVVVVSTLKLTAYEFADGVVECECGVSISKLARQCVAEGYVGYYGIVDLPGTVAAAVYNNAGCFDCSVADLLVAVKVLTVDGDIVVLDKESLAFSTRNSLLKQKKLEGVILSVTLTTELAENAQGELQKSEQVHAKRLMTQEKPAKNLGSVYSRFVLKKNFRNFLMRIVNKFHRLDERGMKRMLLFLYGYSYLNKYISDKNITTFIWIDQTADEIFYHYDKFMHKAYDVDMEIEIKSCN